jgi:predicted metal-dependent phosphoesterase TrpH
MRSFVDLHIHSDFSGDADHSPRQLFEMATDSELLAFSIADHDTVAAVEQGLALSREFGIELVPSVELSTRHANQSLHILAPFIDHRDEDLLKVLEEQLRSRDTQAKGRVARLRELGFGVTFEEVTLASGNSVPVGPLIAEALLSKEESRRDPRLVPYLTGEKSSRRAIRFYRDYFEKGKPAYVEMNELATTKSFEIIKKAGGIPVLAHPGAPSFRIDEETLAGLARSGLEGLEVYSSYHNDQDTLCFQEWAKRYNLAAAAGSDFHGKLKPHVNFGSMKTREKELLEELLARRS